MAMASHRPGELTHHRLLDFVKTALIKIFVSPYASVCDMYCGKVADVEKWDEAQIGHYIGIDVAMSGVNEVKEAWESQRKAYTSEFIELDPCIYIFCAGRYRLLLEGQGKAGRYCFLHAQFTVVL
uniref:mRNA (guanine-N(7))-methyltransferase n=1 Tax=Nicotiana tabacum TaxID=4097 RepID=A0A1S4CAQ3_TOBAC|nr:PREDICTED: mRNA cap guanine-N7 methyltransferase 2-like isoform X2 [Nicotiana tabacum]